VNFGPLAAEIGLPVWGTPANFNGFRVLAALLHGTLHRVSDKNCANFFLSQLRQISTNFDNFWQKDGKEANIMQDALIFHLT